MDPSTAAPPVQPTAVPAQQQLARNPMLPQHPLGAYTDAQYESQNAILKNEIAKRYADILQQLGYTDDNGNFIQGSVESEANRQKGLLRRSSDLATEDVTKQHQQLGTLFSGLRGTDQARAEEPYVNQIADLETQTPLTLQQLYEKASGLVGDYTLQQNQLLADAATRRAAGLQVPSGIADPSADGSTTPPPAPGAPVDAFGAPRSGMDDAFSAGLGGALQSVGGTGINSAYAPASGSDAGYNWLGSIPAMPAQYSAAPTTFNDRAVASAATPPPLPAPAAPAPVAAPPPVGVGMDMTAAARLRKLGQLPVY